MGRAFEHSVGVPAEEIALARMETASFFVLIKALRLPVCRQVDAQGDKTKKI
jgi:hypothetical protein